MKEFLKEHFNTENINNVNMEKLKILLKGESLVPRINAKISVGKMLRGKKDVIAKGQVFRFEDMLATHLDQSKTNKDFGFEHLHYTVSEAAGHAQVVILNKHKKACSIGVRTVEGEGSAQPGPENDYIAKDEVINFTEGQASAKFEVEIVDDEEWEPDEDFFIEIYDRDTGKRLTGEDVKTRVTILDDDMPGFICFMHNNYKVGINEKEIEIKVIRKNGCSGKASIDFETVEMTESEGKENFKPFNYNKGTI